MTEAEWRACSDPFVLLEFLQSQGRTTDRKLRLFAAASCRGIWEQLINKRSRRAVEVVERYADDRADRVSLDAARGQAQAVAAVLARYGSSYHRVHKVRVNSRGQAALVAVAATAADAGEAAELVIREATNLFRGGQCELIRDILGPFRPATLALSSPGGSESAAVRLARAIYDDRAFDHLPVLADALEEAGCIDPIILEHLRGSGAHARGCWAVDLVLARE